MRDNFFVHDGDMDAISPTILNQFFSGELSVLSPAVSCAYKHILAYKQILNSDDEIALILEDDIFLEKDFCAKLEKIIAEIKERKLANFLISLEDSSLRYVKGSLLKINTMLYKAPYGRMTGAYLIDKKCAQNMVDEIIKNKCHLTIDWYHNHCSDIGLMTIYWVHPTIAIQGSLYGKIPSLIDGKKHGKIRAFAFSLTRIYKKILFSLR